MNIRNHISPAAPDTSAATKKFVQVIGPSSISGGVFSLEPNVAQELIECNPSDQKHPPFSIREHSFYASASRMWHE